MIDFLILATAAFIGFAFLKSYGGGEGLNIKVQFAPSSTPEGKRDRRMADGVLAIMGLAFLVVILRHIGGGNVLVIIMPLVIGVVIFLNSYLRSRR
jgi:hypothetical protein